MIRALDSGLLIMISGNLPEVGRLRITNAPLLCGRWGTQDDYNFGKWKQANVYDNLSESCPRPNEHEEVAAMWAAGNARTVRVSGFGTPTPPLQGTRSTGGTRG